MFNRKQTGREAVSLLKKGFEDIYIHGSYHLKMWFRTYFEGGIEGALRLINTVFHEYEERGSFQLGTDYEAIVHSVSGRRRRYIFSCKEAAERFVKKVLRCPLVKSIELFRIEKVTTYVRLIDIPGEE
jgi:hypothetical protein